MTERKPLPGGYSLEVTVPEAKPWDTWVELFDPKNGVLMDFKTEGHVKAYREFAEAMNAPLATLRRVESEAAGLREVLVKAKDGLVCCRHLMLKYGDTKDHFWLGQMDADIEAIKTALKSGESATLGLNETKEV